MAIELVVVPCRSDNYAYLMRDASGAVVLIDAPEAAPIRAALDARGWTLGAILITHHHDDHIAGVEELRALYGAEVVGAAADAHRLPRLDRALHDGDETGTGALRSVVIEVPGHTVGHVAYHLPEAGLAFTGDSLMSAGCGRMFEGNAPDYWRALSRLAALPPDTLICSGHEYTAGNLRFAQSLEPANNALMLRSAEVAAIRAEGRPSVPVRLSEELATNPFLRAGSPGIKTALGMPAASDAEVFAELRRRKDRF